MSPVDGQPSPDRTLRSRARSVLADQRTAFLLVGGVNLLLGLAFFALFHALLDGTVGYLVQLVLAYAAAIVCAFTLHRRFVFKVRGQVLVDLARFTAVQMGSLAVNAAVLPLLVEVVGLPVLLSQLISIAVVVVFNYFGHLTFSFRRTPLPGPTEEIRGN